MYDRASASRVRPARIYHGIWGTGAFQPEEPLPDTRLTELARTPEWYILLAGLGLLPALLAAPWLVWVLVPLAGASALDLGRLRWAPVRADLRPSHEPRRPAGITSAGRVAAPDATGRAAGRPAVAGARAVAPDRVAGLHPPVQIVRHRWFETGFRPRPGGERGGVRADAGRSLPARRRLRPLGSRDPRRGVRRGRLRLMIEDHGRGRQVMRCRIWPRCPLVGGSRSRARCSAPWRGRRRLDCGRRCSAPVVACVTLAGGGVRDGHGNRAGGV